MTTSQDLSSKETSSQKSIEEHSLKLLKKLTLQNETIIALLQKLVDTQDTPQLKSSTPKKKKEGSKKPKNGKEFILPVAASQPPLKAQKERETQGSKREINRVSKEEKKTQTTSRKKKTSAPSKSSSEILHVKKTKKVVETKEESSRAEKVSSPQKKSSPSAATKSKTEILLTKKKLTKLTEKMNHENSDGEENPFALLQQYTNQKKV